MGVGPCTPGVRIPRAGRMAAKSLSIQFHLTQFSYYKMSPPICFIMIVQSYRQGDDPRCLDSET